MRMPNMMVTTFAIILVVGLLGFYWREDNSVGEGAIGLQVGVPIQHALQASKITPMPIVLRLVNNTDSVATLTADGPCKLFRYVVTTEDGGFIQAVRRPEVCEETITLGAIAERDVVEEIRQVPLDTARYEPGAYKIQVKFWNYEGQAEFQLTE